MTGFDLTVFALPVVAGAVAAICGFGIGSILTPLVALPVLFRNLLGLPSLLFFQVQWSLRMLTSPGWGQSL